MKKLNNNLIGKTVMSKQGNIIGIIRDIEKKFESVENTHIKPSKNLNLKPFKISEKGDIIIPFKSLTKVKDIYIFETPEHIIRKTKI